MVEDCSGLIGLNSLLMGRSYRAEKSHIYSSTNPSGRRLCLAFLPDGRAISSGFERDRGWPGGATGFRIRSKTGLEFLIVLPGVRELFLAIVKHARSFRTGPMLARSLSTVNKLRRRTSIL